MIFHATNLSISIRRTPAQVYKFAANPRHLPKWAAGLSRSKMIKSSKGWIADSPMGEVRVKFARKNSFGVLDHDVTLPDGKVVHNPLRVSKNGLGSEVTFTLFRLPGVPKKAFAEDQRKVKADLRRLKALLET